MPYKKFTISHTNFYHVTNRCINKDWFQQPMNEVWDIFENQLYFTAKAFDLEIMSFVLMSNHYHMLLRSPEGNLSEAMNYFHSHTSKELVKRANRINHTWARRFKRTEIETYNYFINAYKYVYLNPVLAGLSCTVESYPYSTLHGLLGFRQLIIPLIEDTILFNGNIEQNLMWLNRIPENNKIEAIRKALRKYKFKLPIVSEKPSSLIFETI